MNRSLRWTAACALALAAAAPLPAQGGAATGAAAQVDALADEYMAAFLDRFPESATLYGLPGHDAALFDNSTAAYRAWEAREDGWARRIRAIDAASLRGTPQWITHGFLLEALESAQQVRACAGELWGVNQMFGWQTNYPFVAQVQPVGSDSARAAALARFRGLPAFIDREIANLREGVRQGYTSPKINVERVIGQIDGLLSPPAKESPLYQLAARDSTPAFAAQVERLIAGEINPAIKRYRDYLAGEYMAAAREAPAVAANPQGAACYRASIRQYTTLPLTPEEVHANGVREMARIQAEMGQIARRSFNTDDVPALLTAFREDPRYTFRSRQAMIDLANGAIGRAKAAMPRAFGILPKSDVVVEPYPEFQEASAPGGEYINPSDDGTRPGIYRINTYQPEKQSRVGLESTAFHETIPGHHLQVAIAQERPGAHPVTRFLFNSGYVEGWALYSERLADELGLFSEDLDRMGLLSNEALRAARLVVDPGMHALGWSRQQAIDYMLAHTAESPESVAREVDRYIVLSGQATAYMTGSLEFFRLREKAKAELGARFDIREFHDRVLEDGSLTLPMLREKVERWIAEKKAAR
jgi:uncharacterized protein (DUF885 family)